MFTAIMLGLILVVCVCLRQWPSSTNDKPALYKATIVLCALGAAITGQLQGRAEQKEVSSNQAGPSQSQTQK